MAWLIVAILFLLVAAAVWVSVIARGHADMRRQDLLMAYHEDGLFDMAAGFLLVVWAVLLAVGASTMVAVLAPLVVVTIIDAKRRITGPRLGPDLDAPKLARRRMWMFVMLGAFMLAGIVVFEINNRAAEGGWIREHGLSAGVLAAAVLLVVAAWRSGVLRLAVYGAVLVGLLLLSQVVEADFLWWVATYGFAVAAGGVVTLRNFLRGHPLRDEPVSVI